MNIAISIAVIVIQLAAAGTMPSTAICESISQDIATKRYPESVTISSNADGFITAERFYDKPCIDTIRLKPHCQESCNDLYKQALDRLRKCGYSTGVVITEKDDGVRILEDLGFLKSDTLKRASLRDITWRDVQVWRKTLNSYTYHDITLFRG